MVTCIYFKIWELALYIVVSTRRERGGARQRVRRPPAAGVPTVGEPGRRLGKRYFAPKKIPARSVFTEVAGVFCGGT